VKGFCETLSQKNPSQQSAGGVVKVKALSSAPVLGKKKKKVLMREPEYH
jgi:hypothetical protein